MHDLQDDHDELRTLMHSFAMAMDQSTGFDADLQRARVKFYQTFQAHVVREEACCQQLPADDPIRIQSAADMQMLIRDYSAQVAAWPPQRVKAEFPAYRRAVLLLQARLRRRLDWEERHLHPRLSVFSRAA
jgi:hypothetical protein